MRLVRFFVLGIVFLFVSQAAAQQKLIHFWDFNQTLPLDGSGEGGSPANYIDSLGTANYPLLPNYSTLSGAFPVIMYNRPSGKQGTASTRDSILDNGQGGSFWFDYSSNNYSYFTSSDSGSGKKGNLFIRARQPSLNSYMYLYIPTNQYYNIALNFSISGSSSNMANFLIFGYSTDGGLSWKRLTSVMDTFNLSGYPYNYDSIHGPDTLGARNVITAASGWSPVSIDFSSISQVLSDPATNNPNFIVRWTFGGFNADRGSANVRFDNFAVMGDTLCPIILDQPINESTCLGGNLTFSVKLKGGLNPGYQWQVDTVGNGTFTNITNGAFYSGVNSAHLTITGVINGMDKYKYRCHVIGSPCNAAYYTSSVSFTIHPPPPIFASPSDTTICAGNPVTLNSSGSWTYNWSGGIYGNTPFIPAATETYTVTGTDLNGCTSTATALVTVNPSPIVNANTTASTVCFGMDITLTGSGNALTYSWSGGAQNGVPFIPPLTAIAYTVTGTSSNGCSSTSTTPITVNPLPVISANSSADPVCAGTSVILSGSGSAITYSWNSGIVNGQAFIPATGTTTYSVTGTDANNCSAVATIAMVVNALPFVTANASSDTVCKGANVTLNGGNALSYSWSGGVQNGKAFPLLNSSSYTVTGTDVNGCSATASLSLTVNTPPVVNATASIPSICLGASDTLKGAGALRYVWSGGIVNGVGFIPASTKTYTVTGTDAQGCSGTGTVSISVKPLPIITASATALTVCSGGSTTLFGHGGNSYSWSGGISNGVVFNPTGTLTYTVTGTSSSGCSNTKSITVSVYAAPVMQLSTSSNLCLGDSLALTVSGSDVYSWAPGLGLSSDSSAMCEANPVKTTTYTVTGNSSGCPTITGTITLTVIPLPIVSAHASDSVMCRGSRIVLYGEGANSYTWTGAVGILDSIPFQPDSSGVYTVTGTDASGCMNSSTVIITVNPVPVLVVSPNDSVCYGSNVTLQAGGASSYNWSPAGSLSSSISSDPVAFPTTTTTYTIIGTSLGCVSVPKTISVTVNLLPAVSAAVSLDSICPGIPDTLRGSGALTYVWTGGVLDNVSFRPKISATYTVTGTDISGCTGTSTAIIYVRPAPLPTLISTADTICAGNMVTISATGGGTYAWNTGSIADSIHVSPASTQTYAVGVSNGVCTTDTAITITVNALPFLVTGGTQVICAGSSAKIQVWGANDYSWQPTKGLSSGNVADPVADPAVTTTYTVQGTTAGCSSKDSIQVIVTPLPSLTVCCNTRIPVGTSSQINASSSGSAVSYAWLPALGLSCDTCSDPTAAPKITTTYTVTVSGVNCSVSDSVRIDVNEHCTVFVPNVFSPNGDGQNDFLFVYGKCIQHMDLIIFDRWGNKVFETTDQDKGWDGTFMGKAMNADDYVYYLNVSTYDNESIKKKGDINLLR